MNLQDFRNQYLDILNEKSIDFINQLNLANTLKEAIIYSYTAGGKRIRPLLLLTTLHAFNHNVLEGIQTGIALEFIHTSSLIHDDLPAMDNDEYRRGKLTNHKVFGEATAILAGDALLVNAFELIASDSLLNTRVKTQLMKQLAVCSGANGMIGGQQLDMENEGHVLDLKMLVEINAHKTGKLIEYALVAAAIIAKQNEKVITILKKAAYHIGIAFQIKDDVLDVVGNKKLMGKPINSDEKNNKYTYVNLLGLEKAKEEVIYHYNEAISNIKNLNINSCLIEEIFKLIINRNH